MWGDFPYIAENAARVKRGTGCDVTYIMGSLWLRLNGSTRKANGALTPDDRFMIQVDSPVYTVEQLTDHEYFHWLERGDPGLDAAVREAIVEQYSEEHLGRVVDSTAEALDGAYDKNTDEGAALILGEIFADAYSGTDTYNTRGATEYTGVVRDVVNRRGGGRHVTTAPIRGPPGERYSAMYRNPAGGFEEFYNFVQANKGSPAEDNKSYYTHTLADGCDIDIFFDKVTKLDNTRGFRPPDYADIFDGLANIRGAVVDRRRGSHSGTSVKLKIDTPRGAAGVVLDYARSGRVIFATAFFGGADKIDAWMQKGNPTALSAGSGPSPDNAAATLFRGNRLTVDSIRDALTDVNTRFSFAGRNATGADSESLALAERMERDGADPEDIRRETGWFRGMEGMWRFEIDDSGMGYDPAGGMRPGGGAAGVPDAGRMTLSDYIDHPALFENYPQLRDFGVEFDPGDDGAGLDLATDTIYLPEKLRGAPQRSLVHEIQHAIQKAEGFSPGASPQYWSRRKAMIGGGGFVADDGWVGLTRGDPERILQSLPQGVAERFRAFREHDRRGEYPEAKAIYDDIVGNGEYLYEMNEFWAAIQELGGPLYPGKERSADDLYTHTAGEIEARDSARRRGMGADERRASPPDLGDGRNVFSDIVSGSNAEASGGYRPEFGDSAISENRQKFAEMGSVSDISGHELDGDAPLKDRVLQYFRENTLYNPTLGEVSFTNSSFRDDRGHGFTREKVAAFAAVPDIVYSGEIINYRKDYPGRGADRIVVAAPISIDGETYYAGVELIRGGAGQRFYLHDVITAKKASMTFTTRPAPASGGAESRATDNLFLTDIIHQAFQEGKAKNTDTRYSLDGWQYPGYDGLMRRRDVALGDTDQAYTEGNRAIDFVYAVVPADALIISNDGGGGVNPDYPAELQPRDRGRAASRLQVQDMSMRLNPRLLADSPTAQNGAPIVRGDGAVIGGNARSRAILTAYEKGRAAEYEDFVRGRAPRYGIDAEAVPDRPVLVRIAYGADDWAALSQELNAATTAAYSSTEQAMTDATRMDGVLELLVPNEDGGINDAANRDFIGRFMERVVPASERGGMITAGGLLSQAGLERAKNAIFAYAYGSPGLLAKLSESLDNDARNVTNALLATAPAAAEIRAGAESGTMHDTGVIDWVLRGVGLYADAKHEGVTVEEHVGQADLFESYTPEEVTMAKFIEKNKRSSKQIRAYLNTAYADVRNLGDPNQVSLFGGESHGLADIIERTISTYERDSGREVARAEDGSFQTDDNLYDPSEGVAGAGSNALAPGDSERQRENATADGAGAVRAGRSGTGSGTGSGTWSGGGAGGPGPSGAAGGIGPGGLSLPGLEPDVVDIPTQGDVSAAAGRDPTFAEVYQRQVMGGDAPVQPEPIKRPGRTAEEWAAMAAPPVDYAARLRKSVMDATPQRDLGAALPGQYASMDEYTAALKAEAAAGKAERLRVKTKDEFAGALQVCGVDIKIENAVGDYSIARQLLEGHRAEREIGAEARKAEARLKPTPDEKEFAHGLAAGHNTITDLPASMDRYTVSELADYYAAAQSAGGGALPRQRATIRELFDEQAEDLLKKIDSFKPKRALAQNFTTPEQLIFDMAGDEQGKKINGAVFWPAGANEAGRIRFQNEVFNKVRRIEDGNGRARELTNAEDALAHKYLEGKAASEELLKSPLREHIAAAAGDIREGMDPYDAASARRLDSSDRKLAQRYSLYLEAQDAFDGGKVDKVIVANAAKAYTGLYDDFHDAYNRFLAVHGYPPVPYRKGYAPHMQPEGTYGPLAKLVKHQLGLGNEVSAIDASIAGLTAGFTPNKMWNPHERRRFGDSTEYSLRKGLQRYMYFGSHVLFHTDDVMRVRALERNIRKKYATEENKNLVEQARDLLKNGGSRDKAEFLREHGQLPHGSKVGGREQDALLSKYVDELYQDIGSGGRFSNFAMWLQNYANTLAGKQSMADRGFEYSFGRAWLNTSSRVIGWFGRAQVAGNLSSAMRQFSQHSSIISEIGPANAAKALAHFVSGKLFRDGFVQRSDFLTGRRGTDALFKETAQQVTDAMFIPLRAVDFYTSCMAVYGRYLKEIGAGRAEAEAMRRADEFGRLLIGSRLKGEQPSIYESKNLLSKMLTIFQREASQRWEHIAKYLPRQYREAAGEKGKAAAARMLAGWIVGAVLTAFVINRLAEELTGVAPDDIDPIGMVAEFFASGFGLTTNEFLKAIIDGGLEGLGAGRPFGTDEDALAGDFDFGSATTSTGRGMTNRVPYLRNAMGLFGQGDDRPALPNLVGAAGGIIDTFRDGDGGLQLPSLPELGDALLGFAGEIVPGGRQLRKTAQGIETIARGGRYRGYGEDSRLQYPVGGDFWDVVRATMFGNNGLPETRGFYASDDSALSKGQTALYDSLVAGGADRREVYRAMQDHRCIGADDELSSYDKALQRRDLIRGLGLTDAQKLELYQGLTTGADSRCESFRSFMDLGLSWDQVMDTFDRYAELDADEEMSSTLKASEFARWVDGQGYTAGQAAALKGELRYGVFITSEATRYEALTAAGLTADQALNLTNGFAALEPADGMENVTNIQRYAVIAASGLTDREKVAAIGTIMGTEMATAAGNPTQYAKMLEALDAGVSVDEYLGMNSAMYRINTDDSLKGAAASNARLNAIMGSGLTEEKKVALYRAFISDTKDDAIGALREAGLGFDDFLRAQNAYAEINERNLSASQKALEFSRWANTQGYTAAQADVIRDSLVMFQQIPRQADTYNKLIDAGLPEEIGYELAQALAALQPPEGMDKVTSLQRYRAVVDTVSNADWQMAALSTMMKDSEHFRLRVAYYYSVQPRDYVTMRQLLDMVRTGTSATQPEVRLVLDNIPWFTDTQRAVLWQLQNKSWAARNNPYSRSVSADVRAVLHAYTPTDGDGDEDEDEVEAVSLPNPPDAWEGGGGDLTGIPDWLSLPRLTG